MDEKTRLEGLATSPLQPITIKLSELAETVDLRDRLFVRAATVGSPVGEMVVCWNQLGLAWVRLREASLDVLTDARASGRPVMEQADAPSWLADAVGDLDTAVPVDLLSVSPFQRRVLEAARDISRGQTRPYGWVAEKIGQPRAVRAVGTALARNPVPLVVPCHRVVKADGSVGNYIFGMAAKERLLSIEEESA